MPYTLKDTAGLAGATIRQTGHSNNTASFQETLSRLPTCPQPLEAQPVVLEEKAGVVQATMGYLP